MTKEVLNEANALNYKQVKAKENFEECVAWIDAHLKNPEKELSLSKIGHGWLSIPAAKKLRVLDLVHEILAEEQSQAISAFANYGLNKN